jgi:GGDEF domain-containing protein
LDPETMKDSEQFLREADENLYIAKSSGKNCVVMNREVSK